MLPRLWKGFFHRSPDLLTDSALQPERKITLPFATIDRSMPRYDTYESPLVTRNASPEMLRLFSPQHKFGLWRRLWLELARCERELGLSRISPDALQQMEAKLDD